MIVTTDDVGVMAEGLLHVRHVLSVPLPNWANSGVANERTGECGSDVVVDVPLRVEGAKDSHLVSDEIEAGLTINVSNGQVRHIWDDVTHCAGRLVSHVAGGNGSGESDHVLIGVEEAGFDVNRSDSRGVDGTEGDTVTEEVRVGLHNASNFTEPGVVRSSSGGGRTAEANVLIERQDTLRVSCGIVGLIRGHGKWQDSTPQIGSTKEALHDRERDVDLGSGGRGFEALCVWCGDIRGDSEYVDIVTVSHGEGGGSRDSTDRGEPVDESHELVKDKDDGGKDGIHPCIGLIVIILRSIQIVGNAEGDVTIVIIRAGVGREALEEGDEGSGDLRMADLINIVEVIEEG